MTMPHLMNCQHSHDGWCLRCVKELHDAAEGTMHALKFLLTVVDNDITLNGPRDRGPGHATAVFHARATVASNEKEERGCLILLESD